MALTSARWCAVATVGCALIVASFASRSEATRERMGRPVTIEAMEYGRLSQRVRTATRRWIAIARRDSILATLPPIDARDVRSPRLVMDPGLSSAHQTLVGRMLARQWQSLGIDSAKVPVTVVVVVDTLTAKSRPTGVAGELTFDYSLATSAAAAGSERCVVIAALTTERITRPGSPRKLAELLAPGRSGPSLLGPCAFQARFGKPGAGIDSWLQARSWDLAARPAWQSRADDLEQHPWLSQPIFPLAASGSQIYWVLSPDALACTAGDGARCTATLAQSREQGRYYLGSGLVMSNQASDEHWGTMPSHFLSDLVTTLGPDRFERFWQSELAPDAALSAAAAMPLDLWTHRWAASTLGPMRFGPSPEIHEVFAALMLVSACVALTAWGWSRRQVR